MFLLLLPRTRLLLLIMLCFVNGGCAAYGGAGHTAGDSRGQNCVSRDTTVASSVRTSEPALIKHKTDSDSIIEGIETWSSNAAADSGLVSKLIREQRSSLTRRPLGPPPAQEQTGPPSPAFGVRFHKCAQVKWDSDPPEISFFLLIHNMASAALGSNLSQVAIRDSTSGIVPFRSKAREVERDYQSFTLDTLCPGAQVVLNYSAHIRSLKSGVLELPAFLTFSSASQNDVSMFGPLKANLTLRINATNRISADHAVHFNGFMGGFFISLVLILLGFMILNWSGRSVPFRLCLKKRNEAGPGPEFTDCDTGDSLKDEVVLEDKIVDVMILEEPHNMSQALVSLEMSSLLHASNHLEAARLQIHKALMVALLGSGWGKLLEVVQGQVMGAEGRLKEQLESKMAAFATQCNRQTRDALETEHLRQREEKEHVKRLCQQADTQTALHCTLLLEKLHKLSHNWLQRQLLVRHEEASARVRREITEQRRVELHKIFCEELEEAMRLGEMDQSTAVALQHQYFTCQELVEHMLDEVVAHQRLVLSERQAYRSFLLQNLQSVHSLMSETFSRCSRTLNLWLDHTSRLDCVPVNKLEVLCGQGHRQVALLRQRLEETLMEEKKALRCGLFKKRRELLSDMLRVHRQQQKALSCSRVILDDVGFLQMLHSWRNLLSSHSSEFSELIKRLDEEAAAEIRKVMTRLLEDTAAELQAIQPSLVLSLQAALPPRVRHLLQAGDNALRQGPALTDKLQQDGQTALFTLNTTREQLQGALQKELREQRESRDKSRAFFRCLCSCQITMSEPDLLQMKLEFHKCFTVMDRCLVLLPAMIRTKLHSTLEEWRSDQEKLLTRASTTGESNSSEHRPGSELQVLQMSLHKRVSLFERLKEQESSLRNEVLEQMQRDTHSSLFSQAHVLSSQLISTQLKNVQSRSRALQILTALMSLQSFLVQKLAQKIDKMADRIHTHWEALVDAEEQFHKGLSSVLDSTQTTDPILSVCYGSDAKGGVFHLQPDCRIMSILQEALHKREKLLSVLTQSHEQWTTQSQVTEELKEQLELLRLQQLCRQELQFMGDLSKLEEIPIDILKEMLRLLLPSFSESELLSVTEALCPKHSTVGPQLSEWSSTFNTRLVVNMRENVIHKAAAPACTQQTERMDEKRLELLQKLLPSVCALPPTAAPVQLPQSGPSDAVRTSSHIPTPEPGSIKLGPGLYMSLSPEPSCYGDDGNHFVRLFVFRDLPPSAQTPGSTTRKRKRNFLNLKKNSVLPMNAL